MKKYLSILVSIALFASMLSACDLTSIAESSSPTEAEVIGIPGTLVAENFTFNIVSAELLDAITLNSGLDIEYKADEGKKILVMRVDATNTSSDVRNVSFFSAYVDNVTVLPYAVLGKYGDRIMMNGAVNPGKTMSAYVMYQVPTEWDSFEICYIDTLTAKSSSSVKFFKSDVTQ